MQKVWNIDHIVTNYIILILYNGVSLYEYVIFSLISVHRYTSFIFHVKLLSVSYSYTFLFLFTGKLLKIFLCFSFHSNMKHLFDTSQPADVLSSINGIRFLSTLWVILGHCYTDYWPRIIRESIDFSCPQLESFIIVIQSYLSICKAKDTGEWWFNFPKLWGVKTLSLYLLLLIFWVTVERDLIVTEMLVLPSKSSKNQNDGDLINEKATPI